MKRLGGVCSKSLGAGVRSRRSAPVRAKVFTRNKKSVNPHLAGFGESAHPAARIATARGIGQVFSRLNPREPDGPENGRMRGKGSRGSM